LAINNTFTFAEERNAGIKRPTQRSIGHGSGDCQQRTPRLDAQLSGVSPFNEIVEQALRATN